MCLTVEFYDTVTGNVLHEQQVLALPQDVAYTVPYIDEWGGWWRWRRRRRFYLTSNPVSARVRLYGVVIDDYAKNSAVHGTFTVMLPEDYLSVYTRRIAEEGARERGGGEVRAPSQGSTRSVTVTLCEEPMGPMQVGVPCPTCGHHPVAHTERGDGACQMCVSDAFAQIARAAKKEEVQ